MASRTSTPQSQSRSRSSSGSSSTSDTTMIDAPPHSPVRLRHASQSNPPTNGASRNPDPAFSLLLSLPRELRDRIYTFTLTAPGPFFYPPNPKHHPRHPVFNVGINLLRANRQVYEEAIPILFTGNKFMFVHPSDCNIFRVVTSSFSERITKVYFRISKRDMRLWTSYLGSKSPDRSLRADLPNLKSLWIFLRCGNLGGPPGMNALHQHHQALQQHLQHQMQNIQNLQNLTPVVLNAGPPPAPQILAMNAPGNQILPPPPVPFVQFAQGGFNPAAQQGHGHGHGLGLAHAHHHVPQHAAQTNAGVPVAPPAAPAANNNTNIPPPPPVNHPNPVSQAANQAAQQQPPRVTPFAMLLSIERDLGLESLCLSLREALRERGEPSATGSATASGSGSASANASASASASASTSANDTLPPMPAVKIVCIFRASKPQIERLVSMNRWELSVDEQGDVRSRFKKMHGVDVCLELTAMDGWGGESVD